MTHTKNDFIPNFEKKLSDILKDQRFQKKHAIPCDIKEQILQLFEESFKIKICLENSPLSLREAICLLILAYGKNIDYCADLMHITRHTVVCYEAHIREKLGVKNRTQAFFVSLQRKYFIMTGCD